MRETRPHWADPFVEKAIALRESGRVDEAAAALEDVLSKAPDSVFALLILGGIRWDQSRRQEALGCFESAVRLDPTLELASKGVFHVLMDMNEVDRAFDEVRRFLALADSQDYRRLIHDLKSAKE